MKFAHVLFTLLFATSDALTWAQSISFTFDDPQDPVEAGLAGVSTSILDALRKARLKSTLYVCGMRVDSTGGVGLIRNWHDAGHELGNHTYSHRNLSGSISLSDFIADAQRNEDFLVANGFRATRFRFPFLKEGDSFVKRDGLRRWMDSHNYASGAVTIDASDWYYNERYLSWLKAHPNQDDKAFRDAYLAHLWDRANYYYKLAKRHSGRSPSLVLLLHINRINARFLPDVISMFRVNGWNTIDSQAAYTDPIYKLRPDVLPAGESLIWQIAKEQGDQTLRYPGEDSSYEQQILDKLGL